MTTAKIGHAPKAENKTVHKIITKASQQLRQSDIDRKNAARRYITISNSHSSGFVSPDKPPGFKPPNVFKRHINPDGHIVAKVTQFPDTIFGYTRGRTNRHYPLTDRPEVSRQLTYPEMGGSRHTPISRSLTRYPTQIEFYGAVELESKPSSSEDNTSSNNDVAVIKQPLYSKSTVRTDTNAQDSLTKFMFSNNKINLSNRSSTIFKRFDEKESKRLMRERYARYKTYAKPTLPKSLLNNTTCMFKLFGPILLSAPHGIKLWRGGTDGRKRRIHYREIWITELVLKLSVQINKYTGVPSSFVIWDRRTTIPGDAQNLDPNYLTKGQFLESPWHEALVQFKRFGELNNCPIMHIDVHGKKDRKSNMDVDFGFKALETRWKDKGFVGWLKSEVDSRFNKLFNLPYCESNDMKYASNVNPSLCGDWGGDLYTMTCQSVCLGIPAFQLEIPRSIRCHLVENDDFISKFAKCIVDVYRTCILNNTDVDESTMKENRICKAYIDKLVDEHIKIQRTSREKQI